MEQTHETAGFYLGRLKDLGLGNKDGIPSNLEHADDKTLMEQAELDATRLVMPTDTTCTACIDGRHTIRNADGSAAEIRLRRVGGSASNFGVALNARASVTETFESGMSLGHMISIVDRQAGSRSAHFGACGGANGEIIDQRAIHENDNVESAARAFIAAPGVADYLGILPSDNLDRHFADVRANARATADMLEALGWDGQAYVDGVAEENPSGVEELAVDENDHDYHGHRENRLVIIAGDKTLNEDDVFVWNLQASKAVAEALAGDRGHEGYIQVLIADIMKHMAVANRLPSDKTPVELLFS